MSPEGRSSVSLRGLVQAEHRARRAVTNARALDGEGSLEHDAAALTLRLAALRERLVFYFGPSRATTEFAARLEAWVRDRNIGPAELDALVEVLAWKES
jgi:hypothetical protein